MGQQAAAQDTKENVKEEREIKEEDTNNQGSSQVKDEPNGTVTIKKEGEEEQEVNIVLII